MDKTLGEKIREVRQSLRMTQQEFAEEIGVERNTVWRWENDRQRPKPLGTVLLLIELKTGWRIEDGS